MVKPVSLANVPPGSTVERLDGKTLVWYPKPERLVVTFAVPECCPTCQRALVSATVNETMAI